MNLWIKYNNRLLSWSLILMAFFINMSISLYQTFFILALLIWLIDEIIYKIYKNDSIIVEKNILFSNYIKNFSKIKFQYFFGILFAWIFLRVIHIVISNHSIQELIQFREIWLFLILPLIIYKIREDKIINLMILFLLLGATITASYNIYYAIIVYKFKLITFNVGGFFNTQNPLTYAGTMSFSIILGFGLLFQYVKEKNIKLSVLLFFLLLIALIGFFLTFKRGPFIAFGIAGVFLLMLFLKRKFFILLPFLIALPILYIQQSESVQNLFSMKILMPEAHQGTLGQRIDMWIAGVKMWLDHLWFGVGDADFGYLYPKYMVKGAIDTARAGSHMHNDFLNTLVLYGSIGFSIFFMFFIIPIIDFFKKYYLIIKGSRKWIIFSSISAIFMMMFLGLSQCHFTDEEVQIVFWLSVAIFYRELLLLDREVNKNENN